MTTDQQQPDQNRETTKQWAQAEPARLATPEENRAAHRAASQVDLDEVAHEQDMAERGADERGANRTGRQRGQGQSEPEPDD